MQADYAFVPSSDYWYLEEYYLDSERSSDEEPCTLSHQRDEEADDEEHGEAEQFRRLGRQKVDHRHVDGREKDLQKKHHYLFWKIGKVRDLIRNWLRIQLVCLGDKKVYKGFAWGTNHSDTNVSTLLGLY